MAERSPADRAWPGFLLAKRAPTEADAMNDPTEVVLAALASHPSQRFPGCSLMI
jgi:hypothetical protein